MKKLALMAVMIAAVLQIQASEKPSNKEKSTYVCLSVEQLKELGLKLDVEQLKAIPTNQADPKDSVVENIDQLKQENAVFIFPQVNAENAIQITSTCDHAQNEVTPFDYEKWDLHQKF